MKMNMPRWLMGNIRRGELKEFIKMCEEIGFIHIQDNNCVARFVMEGSKHDVKIKDFGGSVLYVEGRHGQSLASRFQRERNLG